MNKVLTIFLMLTFQLESFTQEFITLKGVVQNAETGKPVPFASVGVQNQLIATVTNLEGDFTLNIPHHSKIDSIVVSSVGYALKRISLTEFRDREVLSIKLHPSEVLLDAITIIDSLSANEIMMLAMQRIQDNHPSEAVSMEVFYRERQLMDGAYVSLVEAALTVYDEYNTRKRRSPLRTKVRIDELRRSLVYEHPYNSWWQQDNLMMHTWRINPVPYDSHSLDKSAKNGEFKRVSMTTVSGKNTFVIETDNSDFWKSTYFIQTGTYAIVRVEENFDSEIDGPKHWEMVGDSLPLTVHFKKRHVIVDFKKIDNRYHPSFIQLNASHDYYHEGKFLAQFGIIQDFIINNINWKNPTIVKRNEAARIGKSLLSTNYPYNEEFWKSYNILQETPLEKKLIEDLEKRAESLSNQFTTSQNAD